MAITTVAWQHPIPADDVQSDETINISITNNCSSSNSSSSDNGGGRSNSNIMKS